MSEVNYIFRKSPSGEQVSVTRNGNTEVFYSNDYVQDMIDKHMQRHGNSFSVLKHAYEDKIKALEEVLDKVDRVYAIDRDQFSKALLAWYIKSVVSPTIKQDTVESMAALALDAFKANISLTKIAK